MKIFFSVAINIRGGITRIEFTARDNYLFFFSETPGNPPNIRGVADML